MVNTLSKQTISNLNEVVLVIPSLNPDEKLSELIKDIKEELSPEVPIVVINDGSDEETLHFFEEIQSLHACKVLTHRENKGKGAALKTSFHYILENYPDKKGIITVDGDGQHTTEDIKNCMLAFLETPSTVILGSRNFDKESIPLRSRIGNIFTRNVIKSLNGLNLSDTQTGLRVLPISSLEGLLEVDGDRYEYEMNMLLYFKSHQIPLKEVPIKTLYIDENESSHFNPLKDSVKIYSVFLKYSVSALASFLVDLAVFAILIYFLRGVIPELYIIVSTIIARLISASFNFLSNKYLVFKSKRNNRSVLKYSILFAVEMISSAMLVHSLVTYTSFNTEWIVKIIVDTLIFCIGYYIQKHWVFKKEGTSETQSINESKV